jgi:hypothetical protein
MRLTYFIISILFLTVTYSCDSDDESQFVDPLLDGSIYRGDLRLRTQTNVEFYGNLGITKVEGLLRIQTQLDDPIVDLTSLNSINEVELLEIVDNPGLVNLTGLENLQTDFIYLDGNANLENMNALTSSFESTPLVYLGLVNLHSLNDYSALNNVEEFGSLALYGMPLINLEPFSQIKSIRSFSISHMNELVNLESLNLEYFNGRLSVQHNPNLESLSGLESILEVENLSEVDIYLNPALTDFCSIFEFTQQASSPDLYDVWGNGFNPTFQDLLDGDCN